MLKIGEVLVSWWCAGQAGARCTPAGGFCSSSGEKLKGLPRKCYQHNARLTQSQPLVLALSVSSECFHSLKPGVFFLSGCFWVDFRNKIILEEVVPVTLGACPVWVLRGGTFVFHIDPHVHTHVCGEHLGGLWSLHTGLDLFAILIFLSFFFPSFFFVCDLERAEAFNLFFFGGG